MTGKPQVCTNDQCDRKPVARRLCHAHYQAAWKAGTIGQHVPLAPRERKHNHECPAGHKHAGSSTCFIQHQCRCEPCRLAHNAREARRRKLKAYGRFDTGLVDVSPVREHLAMLGEYGIGYKRVAQLAGLGITPVRNIIWGRQDPGPRFGELPKRVKRATADAILAVQPSIENLADGQTITATGTRRRLQALVTLGWSVSALGRRLDISPANMHSLMRRDRVSARVARQAAELFDELWATPPAEGEWREKISASRARRYAKDRGWLPPLAWDDIDNDPEPAPTDTVTAGRGGDAALEDAEWLLDAGESLEPILTAVNRTYEALEKLAHRHGRTDLAHRLAAARKDSREVRGVA